MNKVEELISLRNKVVNNQLTTEQKSILQDVDKGTNELQQLLQATKEIAEELKDEGQSIQDFIDQEMADVEEAEQLIASIQYIIDAQSHSQAEKPAAEKPAAEKPAAKKPGRKPGPKPAPKAKAPEATATTGRFQVGDLVMITDATRAKKSHMDTATRLEVSKVNKDANGTHSYTLVKPDGGGKLFAPKFQEVDLDFAGSDTKIPQATAKKAAAKKTRPKLNLTERIAQNRKGKTMRRSHTRDYMLIKRAKGYLDKDKPYKAVNNLYAASQKAMLERNTDDPMPYDNLLSTLDSELAKLLQGKSPGDTIKFKLTDRVAEDVVGVANEQEVYMVVAILKSYLTSFAGKEPTKDKVVKMRKRIENALKNKNKVSKRDPFYKALAKVGDTLNTWMSGNTVPFINIHEAGLKGLFGIDKDTRKQALYGLVGFGDAYPEVDKDNVIATDGEHVSINHYGDFGVEANDGERFITIKGNDGNTYHIRVESDAMAELIDEDDLADGVDDPPIRAWNVRLWFGDSDGELDYLGRISNADNVTTWEIIKPIGDREKPESFVDRLKEYFHLSSAQERTLIKMGVPGLDTMLHEVREAVSSAEFVSEEIASGLNGLPGKPNAHLNGLKPKISVDQDIDEDDYPSIFGDYDGDGIPNLDDPEPLNYGDKSTVEETLLTNDFRELIKLRKDLKATSDGILQSIRRKAEHTADSGIVKVMGRAKTPFSIINKLRRKRLLDKEKGLTDLVGSMVVFDDYNDLEKFMHRVEAGELGEVVEHEDHYRYGKGDGYKAHHFIIIRDGLPVELQLKTRRLYEISAAAHTPYKNGTLNAARMIELTTMADKADHGNVAAAKKVDSLIADPQRLARELSKK